MLDITMDIQSLSHFKRNTPEAMAQLKKSGRPMVLTVNGVAEAVVLDAAAYQRLSEQAERAEMMAFLADAKAEVDAGQAVPALKALDALARKHKLAGKRR